MYFWKDKKINEKEAKVGPFFKKHKMKMCKEKETGNGPF